MELAVSTAVRSKSAAWLRGAPKCRREGRMVYVTLNLLPSAISRPASVAWSAGGLHATTPRISGMVVTCCIPYGVFEHRAPVKLELLDSSEPDQPILAWTQFPVLAETLFQAGVDAGCPVLMPMRLDPRVISMRASKERSRPVLLTRK